MATTARKKNVWQQTVDEPIVVSHYQSSRSNFLPNMITALAVIGGLAALAVTGVIIFGGSFNSVSIGSLGLDEKTWTVKIGTIKDGREAQKALEARRIRTGGGGMNGPIPLKEMRFEGKEASVTLVKVRVSDLGFHEDGTLKEIYQEAEKKGYKLCSMEMAVQLRLQYENQPMGEMLMVGMEPYRDVVGSFQVFLLAHNKSGQWLFSQGLDRYTNTLFPPNTLFVFVKP